MSAGNLAAQRLRLLDGEDRSVIVRLGFEAEFGEAGEELL